MSVCCAFDTSNYTTSFAVCENGIITESRKIPLPVKEGSRGLRQSDAVFHHTVNLSQLTKGLRTGGIECIGVSSKPRDAEGSYMPCFLSGVACANVLADVLGVPLYEFSHQQGHIMAALYSAGKPELYSKEILAFHLSGGTTELLHCENGKIEIIGGTLDISVGQLIDRTGVKLGMAFPCGPALEKAAAEPVPTVKVKTRDGFCNLSGFENKVERMITESLDASEICAYVLGCVQGAVEAMLKDALERHGDIPVLFAGGVSSNSILRRYFTDKYSGLFPEPAFAADNACGVALLAQREHNDRK